MATHSSSTGRSQQKPTDSSLNKDISKISDETPAKRVKIAHELVTPASSQSSLAETTCTHPTPSPSNMPTSHSPYSLATPMSQEEIRSLLLKEANYDCELEKDTPKREEYLSWDDFFMSVALLSAMRSKDPNIPTGACIVDDEYRVIGIGYNGFPRGCRTMPCLGNILQKQRHRCIPQIHSCAMPKSMPFSTSAVTMWQEHECMFLIFHVSIFHGCCIAANAIELVHYLSLVIHCSTLHAGNECAKVIVQSRISQIVYMVDPRS